MRVSSWDISRAKCAFRHSMKSKRLKCFGVCYLDLNKFLYYAYGFHERITVCACICCIYINVHQASYSMSLKKDIPSRVDTHTLINIVLGWTEKKTALSSIAHVAREEKSNNNDTHTQHLKLYQRIEKRAFGIGREREILSWSSNDISARSTIATTITASEHQQQQ